MTILGKRRLKKEKYGDPTKNHGKCSVLTIPFCCAGLVPNPTFRQNAKVGLRPTNCIPSFPAAYNREIETLETIKRLQVWNIRTVHGTN